jgi:outer membrane murein-binding lipoprotein Lpp
MDTATITMLLKELGVPAITIAGFAWVLLLLKKLEIKVSSDIAKLETKVSSDIAKLETKVSSDIAKLDAKVSGLETKVSGLEVDMKSIKNNHLPHIEAAMMALAKGTENEAHVKAILDLSNRVDNP